jgi:hypothetical protein
VRQESVNLQQKELRPKMDNHDFDQLHTIYKQASDRY